MQGGSVIKLDCLFLYELSVEKRKDYVGKYFCEEFEIFYIILLKEDKLVVEFVNLVDIELMVIEEDVFFGSVYFVFEIKFERDVVNKIIGFKFLNG